MTLRMPAEWEAQDAVWLAWPHNKEDWPGRFDPIPWVYGEILRLLTQRVRVRLLIKLARHKSAVLALCERMHIPLERLDIITVPTDRIWLRDSGATVVFNGSERLLLDWRFNAWAKYNNWKRDDAVPSHMAEFLRLRTVKPKHKSRRVVLEGGAIDVNGKGSLLTTEECLLSDVQGRNPGFNRKDYEEIFSNYLGAGNVIWLGKGIIGDDTHGHVDDLARFTSPSTIVTVVEPDSKDENYAPLQDNLKRLKLARDEQGKQFTIAELPMPKPILFEGQRLPASYANFLITNQLVLVPTFNDVHDRLALSTLAALFPTHEIIGVHCGDFIWGLGTLHCMSQQEPALP